MVRVVGGRLRDDVQGSAAERVAWLGEEQLADLREVVDRVPAVVVDTHGRIGRQARCADVVQHARTVEPAALTRLGHAGGLVTVAPLVIARRVDDRLAELLPERRDLVVVGLGAEVLAGVDVADVDHLADRRVGVDRADERGALLQLCRVTRLATWRIGG